MTFYKNWFIFGCFFIPFSPTMAKHPELFLPLKKEGQTLKAYKTGDYIIGGIFPLHINPYKTSATSCSRFNEIGLAWVESMIYATETLSNSKYLPNISLGYDIRDDCDEVHHATEIALDFVSTPDNVYLHTAKNLNQCSPSVNNTETPDILYEKSEKLTEQSVLAVVGPASSDTTVSTALIFSSLQLTQISYSATSRILSDKFEYNSFFRTIPSDTYQVKAMVDIMEYFNWTYISLLGSDDAYGQLGMSSLEYEASKRNIDIAVKKTFSYKEIKQIVAHLSSYITNNPIVNRSNVLVIFSESHDAYALIKEFQKHNLTGKIFFGTDGWTNSNWVLKLPASMIEGSLGIDPFSRLNDGFIQFMKSQTVGQAMQRNPWFSEFVQLKNRERNGDKQTRQTSGGPNKEELAKYEEKTLQEVFDIEPKSLTKTAYVIDAVHVIVGALKKLLCTRDSCVKKRVSNEQLRQAVAGTNFEGNTGRVHFDEHGDAIGSFRILNVQRREDGKLKFQDVGLWNRSHLDLKTEDIVWKGGQTVISRCSDDCRPGFRKLLGSNNDCWTCVPCEKGFFSNVTNMETCRNCVLIFGLGWNSNQEKTGCQMLPLDYLSWTEPLSIVLLTLTGIFSSLNLISLFLYIKFRDSYVIKGSNRNLSYVLFGILFSCFLSPLVYIGHPNMAVCIIQPTYVALVLTSLMLVILFKTYRILVIFELPPTTLVNIQADRRQRDRRHLVCLMVIEAIVFGVMCAATYAITPTVTFHYADDQPVFIDCGPNWDDLNYVALSIFGTLTVISVYLAYRVRKLPENFNEAYQISSTVFIVFLVWIVTLIAVFGPQAKKKTAYFCISIMLQALVVLLVMILPKLKVVLCNPSKDTSEAIRLQTIAYVMKEQLKVRSDSNTTISTISNQVF